MVLRLLLIGITAFLIQGCAPFSKHYYDKTGGADITTVPWAVITDGEPKLLRGNKRENDTQKMLEDGYAQVGYSSFNAGNVNENGAIAQAKKVHASVVIIYSAYTNTESGALPLTLPNGAYGTTTTYHPYHVRRSDYFATYWIKLKQAIFGVHLEDLTTELRREIGSNKGMLIRAVIKDSPAFQADIFRGDVLRRIGEIEIYNDEKFSEALTRYEGQTVITIIYRNGDPMVKIMPLNKAHR